jgi:hypothetical protein
MTTKLLIPMIAAAVAALSLVATPRPARATEPPTEYRAQGSWQSDAGGAPGKWKAILFKSSTSDALGGTISIEGATVIADAVVQGSMDSGKVSFGVVLGDATVATFSGAADGDEMSGTYSLLQMNDTGAWRGTLAEVKRQAAADTAP